MESESSDNEPEPILSSPTESEPEDESTNPGWEEAELRKGQGVLVKYPTARHRILHYVAVVQDSHRDFV